VVTGAASGIGKKTAELLKAQGHEVVGVDIWKTDVNVDLSTPEGRNALYDQVAEKTGGVVDGLIVCAGLARPEPVTLAVNFFGDVATMEALRPLLAKSAAPRVAVICSVAATFPYDEGLVEQMLRGDEAGALQAAAPPEKAGLIYSSSKAALGRWVRQNSIKDEWAGAGILINMVGPGLVRTPMTQALIDNEEQMKAMKTMMPTPQGRFAEPEDVANLLIFLASPENSHMVGQMMYIDGGGEATVRGDKVW
jgi:NAD(P)-dependent dehydrogenase (short-subunit alcohol dehydrogenase family)